MSSSSHNHNQLDKEKDMNTKRVIINEDGNIELSKMTDEQRYLELLWDGQVVSTSKEDEIPSSFIDKCQDTLESHSSIINVISTEAVEDSEGSSLTFGIPALLDPRTSSIPSTWGGEHRRLDTPADISVELDMLLPKSVMHQNESRDYERKLCEKIAGNAIAGPLLEDFAARLNKEVTIKIMNYAYPAEESSFTEIIRKRSAGEYGNNNPAKNHFRSYGMGTKIMLHPLALDFIPAIKSVGGWVHQSTLENIPLYLNWDMPVPSTDSAKVLIGDFSEFMVVLKPIKLTLKYSKNCLKIKAQTQVLCGFWSSVSLGFARAKIKVNGE